MGIIPNEVIRDIGICLVKKEIRLWLFFFDKQHRHKQYDASWLIDDDLDKFME